LISAEFAALATEERFARVRAAGVRLDSASRLVSDARALADKSAEQVRAAGAGDAYALSRVAVALGKYLTENKLWLDEQRGYVEAFTAALEAELLSDSGEQETKLNVANSYLARAGSRQRRVLRYREDLVRVAALASR